jgi:hypothetical protein
VALWEEKRSNFVMSRIVRPKSTQLRFREERGASTSSFSSPAATAATIQNELDRNSIFSCARDEEKKSAAVTLETVRATLVPISRGGFLAVDLPKTRELRLAGRNLDARSSRSLGDYSMQGRKSDWAFWLVAIIFNGFAISSWPPKELMERHRLPWGGPGALFSFISNP